MCKPCCFCISGRIGAIIIAVVTLIICGLQVVFIFLKIESLKLNPTQDDDSSGLSENIFGSLNADKIYILMIFLAIRVVLCSVISALLIYGVKKERLPFIAANVIFYIIDLLLQTVYGLTRLNHNRHGFAGAVIPFLPTFITGYLIYVIFQAYVETLDGLTLRATRNAQMYQL